MTWQTQIENYLDYPRCCQSFQDMRDHTTNAYGEESAFYCDFATEHRIIESECLADECPFCKLVGFDKFLSALSGLNTSDCKANGSDAE